MRLFGKRVSTLWLLLWVPVLVLLNFFFVWNRSDDAPSQKEVVGTYIMSERHLDGAKDANDAVLELKRDGSMSVRGLPLHSTASTCTLSGSGSWSGPDEDWAIDLNVTSDGTAGSCSSGRFGSLEVSGRSKPHELHWVQGNPDSKTHIWLRQQ